MDRPRRLGQHGRVLPPSRPPARPGSRDEHDEHGEPRGHGGPGDPQQHTDPDDVEVPLEGGNVTTGLVRVGDTVRRPAGPQTPAVHALLEHLSDVGYAHSPRSLGLDDRGRHVLEHVPGRVAHGVGPDIPLDPLAVGRVVRELHDALDGWEPPAGAVWVCPIPADGADLVIHNDLAPWNVVVGPDGHLTIIDWDGCAPGTRLWDLTYTAHAVAPLAPGADAAVALPRVRALADGYGLDDAARAAFAALLAPRTWSMHTLLEQGHRTGEQPWAGLWDAGHGAVWRADAEWIEAHELQIRRALLG